MSEQPIAIELLPSHDRSCIVVILRSNEPIKMSTVTQTLSQFAMTLSEKLEASKSKIQGLPPKKIVAP